MSLTRCPIIAKLPNMDETKYILEKAKELLPNCDWVSDIYELRIIWFSDRMLRESGFTMKEITSQMSLDFIKSDKTLVQLKHEMIKRMIAREGVQNYILKLRNRDVSVEYKYKAFVFGGNRYIAAEVLKIDGVVFK